MQKFGTKIKERRNALGVSQRELGKQVGVTHATISMWESDVNSPKTENFMNLAKALQMSVEELLAGVDIAGLDDETFMGIVAATYPRLSDEKRKALMSTLLEFEIVAKK